MEIEKRLRQDLWKAIQAHYERNDFTEAVRDSVFHACELLREKSGLEDKDGSKLVDAALMGNNPAIVISKNETTTEKDFQQGIAYSFKGIMQAIRNPLSHEKTEYAQEDAEAIILYINFLLNQIDHSGGFTKIESITKLLYDEDTPATEEYAELMLKEVPNKKRYDLIVELYNNREDLREHSLRNFIDKLYDSLSKASKADFTRMLNSSLLTCKDDYALRMYLHYFMKMTYKDLDKLVQLRIESFLLKAVRAGRMVQKNKEMKCVSAATLATWCTSSELVQLLGNSSDILSELILKIQRGIVEEEEFVFEYFNEFLEYNIEKLSEHQIEVINKRLLSGDEYLYNFLFDGIVFLEDKKLRDTFGEAFSECEKLIQVKADEEGDLPF